MACVQGCTSAGILEKKEAERGVTPPKASLTQIDDELTGVRAVLACTEQCWWLIFLCKTNILCAHEAILSHKGIDIDQ